MKKLPQIFLIGCAVVLLALPSLVSADFCSDLRDQILSDDTGLNRTKLNEQYANNCKEDYKTFLNSSGSNSSYTYTLLQPLPSDKGELKGDVSLSAYMAWMYKFALALAGFLAVMMITIGGVEYIASGANEKYKSEATGRITNALYGLVLAFGAYLVLYTINPELVTFKNNQFMNPDKKTETTSTNNTTNNTNNLNNSYTNPGVSATQLEQPNTNTNDLNNNGTNDKFKNSSGNTMGDKGSFNGYMQEINNNESNLPPIPE